VQSESFEILNKCNYAVDRFHFKGHVEKFCKDNCDPDKFKILKDENTSVSEQYNSWYSGHKNLFKYSSYERFHFYNFVLMTEYNNERSKNRKKDDLIKRNTYE
jgi:hypothetical protein